MLFNRHDSGPDLGSTPGPVKLDTVSPTALHRCDVSSEFEATLLSRPAIHCVAVWPQRDTAGVTKN